MKLQLSTSLLTAASLGMTALSLLAGQEAAAQLPQGPRFENSYYGFNLGTYNNARYTYGAKLADLDHDGDLDVVSTKFSIWSSGFSVVLNQGNGTFSLPTQYNSPEGTLGIVTADLNGDTHLDVAVTNTNYDYLGTQVSVYFGTGNGTFQPPAHYTVGTGPVGLVAADLNGDSRPELVTANYRWGLGNTLSLLVNQGNGTFGPATTLPAGSAPYHLEAGDINGDNLPDLVVANEQQKLNVLLQTGPLQFTRTEYTAFMVRAGDSYPVVKLADMDNDNDLDVLYSSTGANNTNNGHIAIFPNQGNGTLGTFQTIDLAYATTGTPSIEVADLNNDGRKDIVASSTSARTTDGYQVILSGPNGGYLPATRQPGGQATFGLMLGDIDQDNDIDILTTDRHSLEVTVHKNQGNGTFPLPALYQVTDGSAFLDTADIDGDGDLDLIASASGRTNAGVQPKVVINNGNGTLTVGQQITVAPAAGSGGQAAKFRDLNGDGHPDVLFNSSSSSLVHHFHTALNDGTGTFGTVQTWDIFTCGSFDIEAVDLDNDNDLDVVVTEWLGCPGIPNSGRRIFISLNDGNGNFGPPNVKVVNVQPKAIVVKDFNQDGKPDLATAQSSSIDIHLGNGQGDILPYLSFATEPGTFDVIADDFNGDGLWDLASCNYGDQSVSSLAVLIGNGDGTFQAATHYLGAYSPDLLSPSGITSGDIDNDGDVDIMVSNSASNDLSVYLNQGNGTFVFRMRYGIYYSASSPIFADFTGDSIKDLTATVALPPSGAPAAVVLLRGQNANPLLSAPAPAVPVAAAQAAMQVYPNPTSGYVQLELKLPQAATATVTVRDMVGRTVVPATSRQLQAGPQSLPLDLSQLANGMYLAEITANGQRQLARVVVAH